jgi:hypothetical protein
VKAGGPATHLPFAAAVMELGLLLREEQVPTRRWEDFVGRARAIPDSVPGADRAAFIELVDLAAALRLPPRR